MSHPNVQLAEALRNWESHRSYDPDLLQIAENRGFLTRVPTSKSLDGKKLTSKGISFLRKWQ